VRRYRTPICRLPHQLEASKNVGSMRSR
jgi:hypothetical protein